jgi:hypothetical protein
MYKQKSAKDALRAIRKKISIYSGKNWAVVLKLLSVLIWLDSFFKLLNDSF